MSEYATVEVAGERLVRKVFRDSAILHYQTCPEDIITRKYHDDSLPLLVTTHAQLRAKAATAKYPVTLMHDLCGLGADHLLVRRALTALPITGTAEKDLRRGRATVRCPSCRGTGEPFSRDYARCPECDGGGELDSGWRWLRAWCLVVGRVAVLFVLLIGAWLLCAVPTAAAASALLSAFGIVNHWDWLNAVFRLTGLFALGSLGFAWCFVRGLRSLRRW